ncbi:MAG: hypothetical protein ACO1SV_22835 [Fimbriimonas sp.]
MRTHLALVLVAGSTALAQVPIKFDETVERRYDSKEGVFIEGLGGCRIAPPSQIACWNMDGKPDEVLAGRIRSRLLGSNEELNFRFGRDTQYLVIRRSSRNFSMNAILTNGNNINSVSLPGNSDEAAWELLRVNPEPDSRSIDVGFHLHNVGQTQVADLPLQKGARAKFGSAEYEYEGFVESKEPLQPHMHNPGFTPDAPRWTLGIGLVGTVEWQGYGGTTAFDRAGRPIQYVDRKGEPVPTAKALLENPNLGQYSFNPSTKPGKYAAAVVTPMGYGVQGATPLTTNINPARIGKLRFQSSQSRRILIRGFPLDTQSMGSR